MTIDFNNIVADTIKNFKGGEKEISMRAFVDENNRIMKCSLQPGASIGMHTHDINSEIIFILEGNGYVLEDNEKHPVSAGMCSYCPKGKSHSLVNNGNSALVFCAVVAMQ